MATIKFWQEMQRVVTIDGQDKLMIGKNSTGEAMYVNMEDINQFLSIVGTAVKPIPGGATEATAVVLQPNASGQTREMNNVIGWFKNPTGSAWEAPSTSINMNWWDGTIWSLGSSFPIPTVDTSTLASKNDVGILNFSANQNFATIFNFNDPNQFGVGIITVNGTPNTNVEGWKYLINPLQLPVGTYTTNLMLTASTYLVVLNEDSSVSSSYNSKGNGAGTLNWTFTITANQSIRFCQADYFTPQLTMKSNVAISFPTSNVFQLSKDAVTKGGLEVEKKDIITKSKGFLKSTSVDTDWLVNLTFEGNLNNLKDSNGNYMELFFTFMRFKDLGATSTIIQIAKRNVTTGVVGVNNISVATIISESSGLIDSKGIFVAKLSPVSSSGLTFNVSIDTTKILPGLINVDLSNKIELNTAFLAAQANITLTANPVIMSLGASPVEFGNYPAIMGQKIGATSLNAGIGGTRMSNHELPYYNQLSFFQIADAISTGDFTSVNTALDALISDALVSDATKAARLTTTKNNLNNANYATMWGMTIQFGTNDFTGVSAPNPIGNVTLSNVDTSTVVGALNYGIGKILTKYPLLKIFVATDTHRFWDKELTKDSDIVPNSLGKYLIEYTDAIVKCSELNHTPVLDFMRKGFFNKYNHSKYFVDGVHPNQLGYNIIGSMYGGFIKSFDLL